MTQVQFADTLGISSRAYHSYERGVRELPSDVLLRLHAVHGVMPNWILLGIGLPLATDASHEVSTFVAELIEQLSASELKGLPSAKSETVQRWLESAKELLTLDASTPSRTTAGDVA